MGRVQREVIEPRGIDISEPSGIADCVTSSSDARVTLVTETNARDNFGNANIPGHPSFQTAETTIRTGKVA